MSVVKHLHMYTSSGTSHLGHNRHWFSLLTAGVADPGFEDAVGDHGLVHQATHSGRLQHLYLLNSLRMSALCLAEA